MTDFKRARAIAEEALDLDTEDRLPFLLRACGGDEELLALARELSEDTSDDFLASPQATAEPDHPESVGPYRIRGLIAAGGMGVVYEAEQSSPRRTVAVKTLSHGFESVSRRRRFQVELEALAALTHPAIAQVYESGFQQVAGESVERPFFAMELVQGARDIATYVEEEGLSTRERVELFKQVVDAVHFGHTRGIIHRDLKPANILVDREGHVKLIDYGIARVSDLEPELQTTESEMGQLVGTIAYLPPEALDGTPGDVRGDVYALGLCLFETLTGSRPIDISGISAIAAMSKLREEEPKLLRDVAPALPRELDWITSRAISKDPERRYPTAFAFAQDLERHLSGQAIEAAGPSAWYRVQKTLRRNALLASVAGVSIVAGVAILIVTLRSLDVERGLREKAVLAAEREREARSVAIEEREQAMAEAERTQEAAMFVQGLFARLSPEMDGPDALAVDLLDEGIRRAPMAFEGRPDLEILVRESLAKALREASMHEQYLEQRQLAVEAAGSIDDGGRALFETTARLVPALLAVGEVDTAREVGERARQMVADSDLLGEDDMAFADSMFAAVHMTVGEHELALELTESAVTVLIRERGWKSVEAREAVVDLAMLNAVNGNFDRAREWVDRFRTESAEFESERSLLAIKAIEVEAHTYGLSGDNESAVELYRTVFGMKEELYGPTHIAVGCAANNLASRLIDAGYKDEAEGLLLEQIDIYEDKPTKMGLIALHNNLGWLYYRSDRFEQAQEQFETYVNRGESLPTAHWRLTTGYRGLAFARARLGNEPGATEAIRRAYTMLEESFGAADPRTMDMARSASQVFEAFGRESEAEEWREKSGLQRP